MSAKRKKSLPPDSKRYWHIGLRERRLIVQGLTDSLRMFGMEVPGDMTPEEIAESDARKAELRALRWKFATVSQRKELRKDEQPELNF